MRGNASTGCVTVFPQFTFILLYLFIYLFSQFTFKRGSIALTSLLHHHGEEMSKHTERAVIADESKIKNL